MDVQKWTQFMTILSIITLVMVMVVIVNGSDRDSDNAFNEDCLKSHNKYRSLHKDTDPLTISESLTQSAEEVTDRYVKGTHEWGHNWDYIKKGLGENIYEVYFKTGDVAGAFKKFQCEQVIKGWYNEKKYYKDYTAPNVNKDIEKYGHFTQMIWRDTHQVGCTKAINLDKKIIYVTCHYKAQGNIPYNSTFVKNVMPLKANV